MYANRLLATVALFTSLPLAWAGDNVEDRIAQARSAAPPEISAGATIQEADGTVLVEGSNGWTCLPDTMPGDNAPMCNDAVWMELMGAAFSQSEFSTDRIGISYMLMGEPEGSGVSNSNPYHADHVNAEDYVETGPHLMIVVPREMLKGIPTDPGQGGPFVMWGNTPYAHIMVPIGDEQE
jgi:hypothetical protein